MQINLLKVVRCYYNPEEKGEKTGVTINVKQ